MSRRLLLLLAPALALVAGAVVVLANGSKDEPEARSATPVKAARNTPVVMLVMDEFPADQLRKPDGSIDSVRYPNFAKLARMGTWFPNHTTVFDETKWAVPAIMDGNRPRPGTRPLLYDHRNNIFSWLGRRGYRIVSNEAATSLCPPRFCGKPIRDRPKLQNLLHGRPQRLRRWVRKIRRSSRATLYFSHEFLPHKPWVYLPSGRHDQIESKEPVPGINSTRSFHDRYLTDHNHRRMLLQLGFTDRQLGYLLRRLQRQGLLKKALVVVTADHGYAWELGVKDRRKVTSGNVDEVATVPLFIKAPGQTKGSVNDAYTRSIDILPTIADLLNIKLGFKTDGRSVFGPSAKRRRTVKLRTRDFKRVVRVGADELERRRAANRRGWFEMFGTGADSRRLFGNRWAQIYRFGPLPELIGRRVAELDVASAGSLKAKIADVRLTRRVRKRSTLRHTHIAGRIDGGRPKDKRVVAVAVNGRIAALGRSFYLLTESRETFSVLVPESSMKPGRPKIRIYAVSRRSNGSLVLTPIGSNS